MSARWENSITDWYQKSRTANLDYLDLSSIGKPTHSNLSHNIDVIYDRLLLHSKVSVKDYYSLKRIIEDNHLDLSKQISTLERENKLLRKELKNLTHEVIENRPLTEKRVEELIVRISSQPKLIEEQTALLTKELQDKLDEVKHILQRVERLIG